MVVVVVVVAVVLVVVIVVVVVVVLVVVVVVVVVAVAVVVDKERVGGLRRIAITMFLLRYKICVLSLPAINARVVPAYCYTSWIHR